MHQNQASPSNEGAAGAPSTPSVPVKPEYRELPTALLLEPRNPARTEMDEVEMDKLCRSIERLGVLQPLLVEVEGPNFRVHAGHRRLIAARMVNLQMVPCAIYPPGQARGQAIKSHENAMRESLNAAQEAIHFAEIMETEANNDVDQLCAIVAQNRDYVEGRLNLFGGDQAIFNALLRGEIGLGVAQELNKVKTATRRAMYLDAAIKGGASVRVVREWRTNGNAQDAEYTNVTTDAPTPESPNQAMTPVVGVCVLCQSSDEPEDFEVLYAHRSCMRVQERQRRRES